MSCSETSEELCEATSLLQLSLVHSETSHLGQTKPSQNGQRSTGSDLTVQVAAPAAAVAELPSQSQNLSKHAGPRAATREFRDMRIWASKFAAAYKSQMGLKLRWDFNYSEFNASEFNYSDINSSEIEEEWDPCDEEQQRQGKVAMNLTKKFLPEKACKEEYENAYLAAEGLSGVDESGTLNCEKEPIIVAAKNNAVDYVDCVGGKVIPPNLGDFELYLLPPTTTNVLTAILFLFVIGNFSYGWSRPASEKKSCPAWVVLMLVVSYLCFTVGFFVQNTAWFMTGRMKNGIMTVLTIDFETFEAKASAESPYHVIQTVMGMGGLPRMAGWLFLILVVGDPLVKLLLVVLAEMYRYSEATVVFARNCIIFVRVTAKWSAPLHFFILTFHCQFLQMNDPPMMETNSVLDLGWACFTLFVLTNVISALSISVPPLTLEKKEHSVRGISERYKNLLLLGTVTCAAVYLVLLALGCVMPLFSLNLSKYSKFLEELSNTANAALAKKANLIGCLWVMLHRFLTSGQLIPLLGFVVLLVGVMLFSIADISAMTLCAFHAHEGNNAAFSYWLNVSRVTRHSALVDVLLAGALLSYLGSFLNLESAVPVLLAAEVVRYFIVYFLIEGVAEYIELPDAQPSLPKTEDKPPGERMLQG